MSRVYDREPGRAAPDASSRALPDEPEPDTLGLIAEAFRRRLRERPRRLRQQATHLLEAARTPLQSTRDTVRDVLELAPSLFHADPILY